MNFHRKLLFLLKKAIFGQLKAPYSTSSKFLPLYSDRSRYQGLIYRTVGSWEPGTYG
jgi:hypothetical protein